MYRECDLEGLKRHFYFNDVFLVLINLFQVYCDTPESTYLITYSYGNMAHFDLPAFTDPQAFTLHILDPDVNTWSVRGVNNNKNTGHTALSSSPTSSMVHIFLRLHCQKLTMVPLSSEPHGSKFTILIGGPLETDASKVYHTKLN